MMIQSTPGEPSGARHVPSCGIMAAPAWLANLGTETETQTITTMAVWIVALILLAGAGFILWLRHGNTEISNTHHTYTPENDSGKARLRPQLERLYQDGRYWGVRIEHGGTGNACEAAVRCADARYSFESAPPLPLPECAVTRCSCRYVGLEEQRQPPPRRQTHDRREKIRYEPKRGSRRLEKDRRKLNKWDDQTNL